MPRTILHVDMDAFFAAVEQRDHPEWKGRPVVVGAPPDRRGVVAAASYEARAFGIRSAMPSREAGRRCPDAIFVRPRMARYAEVSAWVFRFFEQFTPRVEPVSIDEAFLDVTGARQLFGTGIEIAERIRKGIRKETGLTASVGVAPNKFLAKIASEMNKPDGITLVPDGPEAMAAFLAPLPVDRLWGVGKVTCRTLHAAGLRTVGDLQQCSESRLRIHVGSTAARDLVRLSRGLDDRSVESVRVEKSISREYTFDVDCDDDERIEQRLNDLADDVGRRLRARGRMASVVRLRIRWDTFQTLTRQRTIRPPCSDDFRLRALARELYRALNRRRPVRLIGFGVSGLIDTGAVEPDLFDTAPSLDPREVLSRTVDGIRSRHGPESIRRGDSAPNSVPRP